MAARRGPAGIGSELDEALVRAGRYLLKGVVSAGLRTLENTGGAGSGQLLPGPLER